MRGGVGCWIAVMREVGKDSYQHGPPSQVMWGVNFGWSQESVYLLTMLLPESIYQSKFGLEKPKLP